MLASAKDVFTPNKNENIELWSRATKYCIGTYELRKRSNGNGQTSFSACV